MKLKRLVYFLILNIIVSAITTLVVLTIWDRSHQIGADISGNSSSLALIPTETQRIVAEVEAKATATIALRAYQVSAGETLGEIAFAYDITLEELLALNGLSDPDSIGAGATIFVPAVDPSNSEGILPAGEGSSDVPVGNQVDIVTVVGAGDLNSERVQLRGLSDGTLSLTGWRLQDEDGNSYLFPQITLFGSGAVDVYSTRGVDTVVALYWNSGQSIWETGETVTLLDDAGNIQATYTVP